MHWSPLQAGSPVRLVAQVEQPLDLFTSRIARPCFERSRRRRQAEPGGDLLRALTHNFQNDLPDRLSFPVCDLGNRRRLIIPDSACECGSHDEAFLDEVFTSFNVRLDAKEALYLLAERLAAQLDLAERLAAQLDPVPGSAL
jgi:hypothetical protein